MFCSLKYNLLLSYQLSVPSFIFLPSLLSLFLFLVHLLVSCPAYVCMYVCMCASVRACVYVCEHVLKWVHVCVCMRMCMSVCAGLVQVDTAAMCLYFPRAAKLHRKSNTLSPTRILIFKLLPLLSLESHFLN